MKQEKVEKFLLNKIKDCKNKSIGISQSKLIATMYIKYVGLREEENDDDLDLDREQKNFECASISVLIN